MPLTFIVLYSQETLSILTSEYVFVENDSALVLM
jgi:hypothetical protein